MPASGIEEGARRPNMQKRTHEAKSFLHNNRELDFHTLFLTFLYAVTLNAVC